ncbi:MAG TPA: hypothetical protein VGH40_09465, partial [Roseiarcus sp.]
MTVSARLRWGREASVFASTERAPNALRILYLTPGCYDKGGISRYCRYQIQALRENHGAERVTVLSLLGPDQNGFEEPFAVSWRGG